MNFQQLEYIVALNNHRHFAKAAKACFVTQPTLSMMVQRLEEELEVVIFDRSKQPIAPTSQGKAIIEQAQAILGEAKQLQEIIKREKEVISGVLTIGIIPTLAPYLIPIFISSFLEKYPLVQLKIEEINTETIIEKIKKGKLDAGLLATPLYVKQIEEDPLFYEAFYLYAAPDNRKSYVVPEEINSHQLLLLEEGHCLRAQVINLCELRKNKDARLVYYSGSLETLKRLVESDQGITILPELATWGLSSKNKKRLVQFKPPSPVREISLVKHRNYAKVRLIDCLKQEILSNLPKDLKKKRGFKLIEFQDAESSTIR